MVHSDIGGSISDRYMAIKSSGTASVCISLFFLFLAAPVLIAFEREPIQAEVLEITRPVTPSEASFFRKVISDATSLELGRSGLLVKSAAASEDASIAEILDAGAEPSRERIIGLVNEMTEKPDFVLLTTYSVAGESIRMDLSWYDVAEKRWTAGTTKTSQIGLDLDLDVIEAVGEIIAEVEDRLAEFPKRPIDVGVESEDDGGPEARQTAGIDSPGGGTADSERSAVDAGDDHAEMAIKHFELSIGFAPFLTIGNASDYFKTGIFPTLYGGYRFATPLGLLCLGLQIGVNLFNAEGTATTSDNILVPLGADIRLVVGDDSFIAVFFRIFGGAALFRADYPGLNLYRKIVPYAGASLGILKKLSSAFGIGVDLGYTAFFDTALPISGFTPSANLFWRF